MERFSSIRKWTSAKSWFWPIAKSNCFPSENRMATIRIWIGHECIHIPINQRHHWAIIIHLVWTQVPITMIRRQHRWSSTACRRRISFKVFIKLIIFVTITRYAPIHFITFFFLRILLTGGDLKNEEIFPLFFLPFFCEFFYIQPHSPRLKTYFPLTKNGVPTVATSCICCTIS